MTPGVSYSSVSSLATFAMITGTADANYGVANLGDTVLNSKVSRLTHAGGVVAFSFDLSTASPVQFMGLVRHNLAGAQTVRLRFYSAAGLGGSLVADSGVMSVWPSGVAVAGYSPTRPYPFTAEVTALSGRVDFAGISSVLEIGALEIARWWAWTGLEAGYETGFETRNQSVALAGGGADGPSEGWTPRTMTGSIPFLALSEAATKGLDFQRVTGRQTPFVYVEDYDTPASWARACWAARNREVPPSVGRAYRHDRFALRFIEHLR